MKQPELAIIILNWNNGIDTCECIASLLENTHQNFKIILIDNGSSDDSIQYIQSWANGEQPVSIGPKKTSAKNYNIDFNILSLKEVQNSQYQLSESLKSKLLIIKSKNNMGFARGCNIGIQYAIQNHFKNILLLNNDTTVDKKCIETLIDHKQYIVITPKIYYYDKPNQIWNFGGKLTLNGSRKYYYQNKIDMNGHKEEVKEITFITGCALFAHTEIFEKHGLLSEKFFFGEEDYEFSLRMKKHRVKMVALSSAKVYHKIGLSSNTFFYNNSLAYIFVHYLNRYIDMKMHYPAFYWNIWKIISLFYILPMLIIKKHFAVKPLSQFTFLLITYSNNYNDVNKNLFNKIKKLFN